MTIKINNGLVQEGEFVGLGNMRLIGLERPAFRYSNLKHETEITHRMHRIPNIEDHLFHYTNYDGFIGIINSGEFWLSSIGYSNDSEEIQYPFRLLRDCVTNSESINSKNIEKIDIHKVHSILSMFTNKFLDPKVFFLSLSPNGNQLSQWRGYGGKGGVSIGLSKENLKSILDHEAVEHHKVTYDHNEQIALLSPIVERLFKVINMKFASEDAASSIMDSIVSDYLKVLPVIKHEAFAEEAEHRIISRSDKIQVRSGGSHLVPYTKLKIPEGTVFSVIIGPQPDLDGTISAISDAFDASKFKYDYIMGGQVPYI